MLPLAKADRFLLGTDYVVVASFPIEKVEAVGRIYRGVCCSRHLLAQVTTDGRLFFLMNAIIAPSATKR
jgi:hypothetical protein